MSCLVYHRTDAASAILAAGFRDSTGKYGMEKEYSGVWVSDVPLDVNDGAVGHKVLEIQVPQSALAEHEVVDEHPGTREWLVPSNLLNRYPRRLLTEAEVDAILDEQFRLRVADAPPALRDLPLLRVRRRDPQ